MRCWAHSFPTGVRCYPTTVNASYGRRMATCVTSWELSQSPSASSSAVMVPKVRTNRRIVPSGLVSSTQATTVLYVIPNRS